MSRTRTGLLKGALSALHYTGADRLLAPFTRGVGVIFKLHGVRLRGGEAFAPHRLLEITPEFLDQVIALVSRRGFTVLSLDDMQARLAEGDFDRPFACFTFDGGSREIRDYAYPIFKRHDLPFTVYVPSDFPDGRGDLWWLELEMVIAASAAIEARVDGVPERIVTTTPAEKYAAFARLHRWLRTIPEFEARLFTKDLCCRHGVDVANLCRNVVMSWDELRDFSRDPLVTVGAQTRRHLALARLSIGEARQEMDESIQRLEHELGCRIHHFSYPYGDEASAGPREFELARELGMLTAVTARAGLVHEQHADLATGLPRVSLTRDLQSLHYVKVMLSGAPFAFSGIARRLPPDTMAARLPHPGIAGFSVACTST